MPLIWDTAAKVASVFSPAPEAYTQWTVGITPLSTWSEVVGTIAAYVLAVKCGQWYMADRKPAKFRELFIAHNLLLSVGSFVLLALTLEQVVPYYLKRGFHDSICATDAWTPQMERLYIINYAFKYYELLDTAFLVAKKKPIIFLHFFHHPATAFLCFVQLKGKTSVSWVPIVLNLAVHTIMYWYYYTTSANPGIKPWYKQYITTMQISQFVLDIFAVYYASYHAKAGLQSFAGNGWIGEVNCAGTDGAALLGCGLLTSYLALFAAFYKKTYKKASKAKAAHTLPEIQKNTPLIEITREYLVDARLGS